MKPRNGSQARIIDPEPFSMIHCIPITEDLLDACAAIYVDTFNAEPWNDAWDVPSARRRLANILHAPGFFGLAILRDQHLCGAAFGEIEPWFQGSMFNLREMFVANDQRGTGLGSELLFHLEVELRALGVHTVHLFTSTGDLTERFYQRNGYRTETDMRMLIKTLS